MCVRVYDRMCGGVYVYVCVYMYLHYDYMLPPWQGPPKIQNNPNDHMSLKIHQRGVQWKQGVLIYMIIWFYILVYYNTTPIHGTPLRLHPPLMNTHTCRRQVEELVELPEEARVLAGILALDHCSHELDMWFVQFQFKSCIVIVWLLSLSSLLDYKGKPHTTWFINKWFHGSVGCCLRPDLAHRPSLHIAFCTVLPYPIYITLYIYVGTSARAHFDIRLQIYFTTRTCTW